MSSHHDVHQSTRDLLAYIDASPTPYHAVSETARQLTEAGFTALDERDDWRLQPGGRHFVTRGGSTIAAFCVGSAPPAETGFRLVGAHVDSPNLRLKPVPAVTSHGYRQFGIEVYGGALTASWTDRDLSLAGRVHVRGEGMRLLLVDRPLCRVPQLAIHLNRDVNKKGLLLNAQKHLLPVVGLAPERSDDSEKADGDWVTELVASELGVQAGDVLAFDLMLFDVTPSVVSGMDGEFVHAPRLDNLASCHAGLAALVEASATGADATRGFVFYDHEEVGSNSAEGAGSPFLESILERIVSSTGGGRAEHHRAVARSLCVSAEMAHAVHPNYADQHDPDHRPLLNGGPVIKINQNQRYASNADTIGRFAELAREADVPVQRFANRADLACGSTIGPITATRLGMPTVDVGNAMLSMHSVREMAGARDHELMVRVMRQLFA